MSLTNAIKVVSYASLSLAICITIHVNVEWLVFHPDRTMAQQLQLNWIHYLMIFTNGSNYILLDTLLKGKYK